MVLITAFVSTTTKNMTIADTAQKAMRMRTR
jgi:hypothetical protein